MESIKKIIALSCLFIIIGCSNDNVKQEQHYIAHAGGTIEGYTYTNSKEAVEHAIACGIRYIELDLVVTSDGKLVAAHDWKWFRKITNTPPISTNLLIYKHL